MEVENPRWRSVKTIDALYNKLPGHAAPAGVVAKARAAAAAAIRGLRECQECRAETRAASGVTKDLQVCPSRRGRQTLEIYCSHSLGGLVGRTRWEDQQTKAENYLYIPLQPYVYTGLFFVQVHITRTCILLPQVRI